MIVRQSEDGNIGTVCDSLRLDQRPVDSVEIPNEPQHLGKVADSMLLGGPKHSRDRVPSAEDFWAIEPDHMSCAKKAYIEAYFREVAVADPGVTRVRFLHQSAESENVIVPPIRLPDCVEANHGREHALTEPSRESSFAAARAAQDDDSRHR
jgi:hypothetical protein